MEHRSLDDLHAAVTTSKAAFLDVLSTYFAESATEHDPVLLQLLALPCRERGLAFDAALVALAEEIAARPDAPTRADVLQQIDQQRRRVQHLLASVRD